MHTFHLTTDLVDRIGRPQRNMQALRLEAVARTGGGPERLVAGPACCTNSSDDQPTGWPGIDDGIRAPYVNETQLSMSEIQLALAMGVQA